jgi:hypothetical protein
MPGHQKDALYHAPPPPLNHSTQIACFPGMKSMLPLAATTL